MGIGGMTQVCAIQVCGLPTSILLFDHRNDLFVCETCLRLSVFLLGRTLHKTEGVFGAQVNSLPNARIGPVKDHIPKALHRSPARI